MALPRILILFAHPAFQQSRAHRRLAEAAKRVEGVTFHDLYERYPDLDIDIAREQELLAAHDLIVMQHPFYWYSTPPMLKQWEDLVLEHGWAYGRGGDALRGKSALSALTTGGGEAAYQEGGRNRYTIRQLLAPIEQTWRLCGVRYLPPFVVAGTHARDDREFTAYAEDYARLLEGLRDGALVPDALESHEFLNHALPARAGG